MTKHPFARDTGDYLKLLESQVAGVSIDVRADTERCARVAALADLYRATHSQTTTITPGEGSLPPATHRAPHTGKNDPGQTPS